MEDHRHSLDARDRHSLDAPEPALAPPDLVTLATGFRAALAAADGRGARAGVAQAADSGVAPGELYVSVVRPCLAELQRPGLSVRARFAVGVGEAILADLLARVPSSEGSGAGRAAVLSCRDHGIEAVDGSVAMDFLECDGWTVDRLASDVSQSVTEVSRGGGIELAVAVVAGPEDAVGLGPACTELRRLPDPPVIILCDFSGRSRQSAAVTALGADAVANDPQELVRCAAQRLPSPGLRRWGVRLSRRGSDLMLAPTGRLDATSVGRLADVAATRRGSFDRLFVDLGDLAEIMPAGVTALGLWPARLPGIDLRLVADAQARQRLDATGIAVLMAVDQSA